jgi:hypothetical protein
MKDLTGMIKDYEDKIKTAEKEVAVKRDYEKVLEFAYDMVTTKVHTFTKDVEPAVSQIEERQDVMAFLDLAGFDDLSDFVEPVGNIYAVLSDGQEHPEYKWSKINLTGSPMNFDELGVDKTIFNSAMIYILEQDIHSKWDNREPKDSGESPRYSIEHGWLDDDRPLEADNITEADPQFQDLIQLKARHAALVSEGVRLNEGNSHYETSIGEFSAISRIIDLHNDGKSVLADYYAS